MWTNLKQIIQIMSKSLYEYIELMQQNNHAYSNISNYGDDIEHCLLNKKYIMHYLTY